MMEWTGTLAQIKVGLYGACDIFLGKSYGIGQSFSLGEV